MVVSAHPLATQAGVKVLQQGGNAFDAAAATALVLAVAEPYSSGIGGGGFFLLYIAKEKRYVMIDARETSPKLAGYGEIYQTKSSIDGPPSAGVPGLIAGIDHIIARYGRLSRQRLTKPAIRHAKRGVAVTSRYQAIAKWRQKALATNQARDIFLDHGRLPELDHVIRQPALAKTLKRFARHGAADFYRGETAKRLVADMKRDGGLIRMDDLAAYRIVERTPVTFKYRGFQVVSAPLPSSGGLVLAEIFGLLAADDLAQMDRAARAHLLIEAMRRAYRDRAAHMGDPDFITLPKDLLAPSRLKKMRAAMRMDRATPSRSLPAVNHPAPGGNSTTHFSIVDRAGNMVAATLSINYGFGSGYVSPGTGILLNDEMDDFVTRPGKANVYGLVGSPANHVAPGKRMLSSMTPTFVIGPNRTLIAGTPGGSRIISMVLHAILAFMLDEAPPEQWPGQRRYHHQYLPDEVQHEAGAFSQQIAQALKEKGHLLKQIRNYGNMQAILWIRKTGKVLGLADPRGEGAAGAAD